MNISNPFEPIGDPTPKSTAESTSKKPTTPDNPFAPVAGVPNTGGMATKLIFPNVQVNDTLESYAEYGVPLNPLLNLDEERARRQSTSEKWANGAAKMFTTAGASFLDGTIGSIVGLGNLAIGGSFYDNPFGRGVDDFNEWMQKELPNYYTQAEMNAEGLSALGYANFWADKTLNGVGYMAGNIASTFVGVGALKLASTGLKAYRVAKAAATGTQAAKAFGVGARISTKGLNAAKTAGIGTMSALAEASVEARQTIRAAEERLTGEAVEELGVMNENYLPDWKKQEIKDRATDEANIAFWLNTAVVGGTNLLTFGNILLPKYLQFRPGISGINRAARGAKWADQVAGMPKWARKSIAATKPVVEGAVTESFQEGMQFAIQETSEEMAAADGFVEMMGSLGNGYLDAFGSKEGLDSMMVGAIVGMFGGGGKGIQGVLNMSTEDETRAKLLSYLNNSKLFNIVERAEQSQESLQISAQMLSALERGDHKTYRDRQMDLLINEAIQFENAGRMDLFQERLNDELQKSDEEFKASWGIPDNVNYDKTKIVTGIKENLKRFQTIKETIDARYPDLEPYNFPIKKLKSKEEQADRLMQIQSQRAYKNLLYKTAFKLEDIDSRIEKLGMELGEMAGTSLTDDVIKVPIDNDLKSIDQDKAIKAYEAIEDARQKVLENRPQDMPEFRDKANDLASLMTDRADAIIALNNLNGSPEEQAAYLQFKANEKEQKRRAAKETSDKNFIQNATTLEELEDFINGVKDGDEVSNEVRSLAEEKYNQLRDEALESELESNYKSLNELEREAEREQDPEKKKVLNETIKDRKAAGQTEAPQQRPEGTGTSPFADPASPAMDDSDLSPEELEELRRRAGENNQTPGNKAEDSAEFKSAEQVLAILRKDVGLELSKDKQSYVTYTTNEKGERVVDQVFERVSSLKGSKYEPSEATTMAANRGTIIDDMFRSAIVTFNNTGKLPSKNDLKQLYDQHAFKGATQEFTDTFLENLESTINEIVTDLTRDGYTLYTDFPPIFGTIKGKKIAGQVDFIAYNKKKGYLRVLDLKTANKSRRTEYKKGPEKGWYLKADAIQLTAYAELIRQMTGTQLINNMIVPVRTYRDYGSNGKYRRVAPETAIVNGKKQYVLPNPWLKEAREFLGLNVTIDAQLDAEDAAASQEVAESVRDAVLEAQVAENGEVTKSVFEPEKGPTSKATRTDHTKRRKNLRPSIANGELSHRKIDGRYKVVVSDLGEHIIGNDRNQTLPNGMPLNINREFIKNSDPEALKDMVLELELLDTSWSVDPENAAIVNDLNTPVGVYAITTNEDGTPKRILIGMLSSAERSTNEYEAERRKIVNSLRNNIPILGSIQKVNAANPIETVEKNADGTFRKRFFPILEAAKGVKNFILASTGMKGTVNLTPSMKKFLSEEEQSRIVATTKSDGSQIGAVPGRILMLSNRPGSANGLGVIPAYTAKMDKSAINAVKAIATRTENLSNIIQDVQDIVGLPYDYKAQSVFYVQKEKYGDATFYFKDKEGNIVRITNENLQKALLNDGFVKFSIGKFVPKTEKILEEEGEEPIEVSILDPAGNQVVVWKNVFADRYAKIDEMEGLEDEEVKNLKAEVAKIVNEKLRSIRPDLVSSFEESLAGLYRQVDLDKVYRNAPYQSKVTGKAYPTYLDYLSSTQELDAPQMDKPSILTMDSKAHRGSFYYDVQVEFSTFEAQMPTSKESVSNQVTPNPQPSESSEVQSAPNNKDRVGLDAGYAGRRGRRRGSVITNPDKEGEEVKNNCKGN